MTASIPEIAHSNGWGVTDDEREPVFVITKPRLDPTTGEPVTGPDPAWEPSPSEDSTQPPATAPIVPLVDRITYTIPTKPNVGMALQYLKMARTVGADPAISWILEAALGEEGYDALAAEPDTDPAVLQSIINTIVKRALGGIQAPKA